MRKFSIVVFALACCAAHLSAQERFVTQVLMVPTFHGANRGDAHRAADIVRNRLADAFHDKGVRVISAGSIAAWLEKSGYDEDMALLPAEQAEIARHFRADEEVFGTVARTDSGFRVEARIVLTRDTRMVQPLSAVAATVDAAAEAVARDAIAARGQMIPLRGCENDLRAGQNEQAVAEASRAVASYPRATLARDCLLSAVFNLPGVHNDSLISVSRAVLAISPADPLALEILAAALDAKGEFAEAGGAWVRLVATDSMNETLVRHVVQSLSHDGNAALAEPIVVAGTARFPDNIELVKLRWLVHLAVAHWDSAVVVGETLRAQDAASQADPDFFRRLASAYRSDSQPVKALEVAAAGVAKFSSDGALYSLYVQLVQGENDAAVPRGLMKFPENADLHAIEAQTLKAQGAMPQAAAEMKRALAVDPGMSHGWLQLADLQMTLRQPDSALVSLDKAIAHGESRETVAQFALGRGNDLFTAANGTKQRADFERAHKFLELAKRLQPTPQAAFLLGATALSVSQSAATEGPATKSCALVRLADSSLTEAEENLNTGRSVAPDAAQQFLDYASTLRPYLASQLKVLCPGADRP